MEKSWVEWSAAILLGGILLMAGLYVGGCTEKKSEDVRTQEPAAPGPYGMGSPGTEAARPEEKAQGLEPTSPPLAPATPEAAKEQKPGEKQRPARG